MEDSFRHSQIRILNHVGQNCSANIGTCLRNGYRKLSPGGQKLREDCGRKQEFPPGVHVHWQPLLKELNHTHGALEINP